MKKIINKLCMSFLVLTLISFMVELQGVMRVKAIDTFRKNVVGLLPYYRDDNGHIHVLAGKYEDPEFAGLYNSAPVEFDVNEESVDKMAQEKINEIFGKSVTTNVSSSYQIGEVQKKYYLYLVQVESAQIIMKKINDFFKSNRPDPMPKRFNNIDLFDYMPPNPQNRRNPWSTGELFYAYETNDGVFEMYAVRGFADCFEEVIKDVKQYFPAPAAPAPAAITGEVKAIDENINQVSGFLPYYVDNKGDTRALVGQYMDLGVVITSAPVEISGYKDFKRYASADVSSYFKSFLKIDSELKIVYKINNKDKFYYLWPVEIAQSDVAGLMQSLLNQPGNKPAPSAIVDINIGDYISGANVSPKKEGPLFTEFMRKTGIISSVLEMRAARGFSDAFQQMTKDKTEAAKYFPVTPAAPVAADPVAGSLATFADTLNKLAPQIK